VHSDVYGTVIGQPGNRFELLECFLVKQVGLIINTNTPTRRNQVTVQRFFVRTIACPFDGSARQQVKPEGIPRRHRLLLTTWAMGIERDYP